MDLIQLKGDELAEAVCRAMEPNPPAISAKEARKLTPGFVWVSCHKFRSPNGWWEAEIGTDHGPPSEDNEPVRWSPLSELGEYMPVTWQVVDEMKERGWLMSINAACDGWIVNAKRYDIEGRSWADAMLTNDFVQEIGDTAEEAICRAAVAALGTPATTNA